MPSFFSHLARYTGREVTVVVVDAGKPDQPRPFRLRPARLWLGLIALFSLLLVCLLALFFFTPLRKAIPGQSASAEVERNARLNALRLVAFQDSLEAQQAYAASLRRLITGEVDSSSTVEAGPSLPDLTVTGELAEVAAEPQSENWADHEQPALPLAHLSSSPPASAGSAITAPHLGALQWPVQAPVEGFLTRGFDARTGHYGADIAVEEGTPVRSIGDGHVILADWTHDGGYAIAVQHAGGYVSVYKHNQRLLKRVGDRVSDREALAVSGNSGEVTTGPHLHFELWNNGLAQDPRYYFIGW